MYLVKSKVLLVEDNLIDQMTVKRALEDIHTANPIAVVNNGEEGLAYLRNENNERPCMILLDLNMPKMSGVEFLTVIKNDPHFKTIPVIVLTTSIEEQDRVNTFNLSVAGYMMKPVNYVQFVEVMRTINLYWTLSEML